MLKITPEQAEASRKMLHDFRMNSFEQHEHMLRSKQSTVEFETVQLINGKQITVKLRD